MKVARYRHRHRRRRRETPWWYLSFADMIEGVDTWLGGSYVQTDGDLIDAVKQAHALKINPGGECYGVGPIESLSTDRLNVPQEHRNRLLTKEELASHSGGLLRFSDLP